MRIFANLFQVLLIANGAIFLLAGKLFGGEPWGLYAGAYSLFSSIVILLAFPFFFCLGLNRNLPKRVFLPQLFLLFWIASGLWPLDQMFGRFQAQTYAAMAQVGLGLLALLYFLIVSRQSLFLTPEMFSKPGFKVGGVVRFVIGCLLFLPACLIFFGFSSATSYVDRLSGGFVRLGTDGLYMTERVYGQDDKTIRLASMIHIADQEYYDELARSMFSDRTIVLAEGVSDEDGLLDQKFGYGGIADLLGLADQNQMPLEGRVIDIAQLEQADFPGPESGRPDLASADIDLRNFDPRTLEFIKAMAANLLNNDSYGEGFEAFNRWAQENVTPDTNAIIMNDLVEKRNRVVLGHMAAALQKYDTIVIPWGALHMAGIEKAVIDNGFQLQESRERRSIDFSKLPYDDLIDKFSTAAE